MPAPSGRALRTGIRRTASSVPKKPTTATGIHGGCAPSRAWHASRAPAIVALAAAQPPSTTAAAPAQQRRPPASEAGSRNARR